MNGFISEWYQESWTVGIHLSPLRLGCAEAVGSCTHPVSAGAEAWVNSTGQTDLNIIKQRLIFSMTQLGKTALHGWYKKDLYCF